MSNVQCRISKYGKHINLKAVQQDITKINGVIGLHDVHIWSLEGETDVFTGHIVVDASLLKAPDQTKKAVKEVEEDIEAYQQGNPEAQSQTIEIKTIPLAQFIQTLVENDNDTVKTMQIVPSAEQFDTANQLLQ